MSSAAIQTDIPSRESRVAALRTARERVEHALQETHRALVARAERRVGVVDMSRLAGSAGRHAAHTARSRTI